MQSWNDNRRHGRIDDDRDSRELVTAIQAARMLNISRAHLYRLHNAGKIPSPVRLGGSVRWRVSELHDWIDSGMPMRVKWEAMKGAVR